MIDADKWPASSPLWRVSYQYKPQPSEIDSYDSWATGAEAIAHASARIGEPNTFDKVRISWPHYLHESPQGEGWVAVADLTPEAKRSLDLLLMPH